MERSFAPPRIWLPPWVAHLDATSRGQSVEGVVGGAVWMSLRVGGRFLWIVSVPGLRLAWLDDHPAPRSWLDLLQRHRRSPFAAHLRGRALAGAHLLVTADGVADGFALRLDGTGGPELGVRFWPRPGALWLTSAAGEELAWTGRRDAAGLEPLRPGAPPGAKDGAPGDVGQPVSFDPAAHAAAARVALARHVTETARRRARRVLGSDLKKQLRLEAALRREAEEAQGDLVLRTHADTLAAHLHAIRPGQAEVALTGFDGKTLRIRLDPARTPAANLDRLYRRAAKAERKAAALKSRREVTATRRPRLERALQELESAPSLEAILDLASAQEIDVLPPTAASRRPAPRARRPYWRYRIEGGWEVRVGRSARDNDELTARHSTGKDVWLHAAGVEGSHVVLRTAGRETPARAIEDAARLAAQFSRARHSETVPVLVTERRYVRKPRGAAPGSVVAERARTLFVSPQIPEGCVRVHEDED